jgi:hypothetical protein
LTQDDALFHRPRETPPREAAATPAQADLGKKPPETSGGSYGKRPELMISVVVTTEPGTGVVEADRRMIEEEKRY